MAAVLLNVDQWADEQFGSCALGDRRCTARLVQYAAQAAADPSSSTPKQTESWSECKAAYHSSLMVRPDGHEIVGLAGQVIHYRRPVKREPGGAQRLRRKNRESVIWSQVIEQIGAAPAGVRFLHVFDRGGDQFELFCRMARHGTGWVVRAAQLHRWVLSPESARLKLSTYLKSLAVMGQYQVDLPANPKQPARTASIEVRFGPVRAPQPKHISDWVRKVGIREISMWVVETREIDPPPGVEGAQWVLWTSEPVRDFDDAWRVLEHYEKRWLIEEFHKALKTGCRLEERQYEAAHRLEAVTGILSILAVRLLQLKMVARKEPQRPASEVVPGRWITMLQQLRRRPAKRNWTVRDFYRELAKLGGFLGRKSDGEPGWMTLWRGFEKLHLCLRGADAIQRKCG